MLRACKLALKPGGVTAHFVIAAADHLTLRERARLVEEDVGPVHLDAGPGYLVLMRAAGFESVEVIDVSDEYLTTTADWIREREAEAAELERLVGKERFQERLASSRRGLEAIEAGLLRRYLAVGIRSPDSEVRSPSRQN